MNHIRRILEAREKALHRQIENEKQELAERRRLVEEAQERLDQLDEEAKQVADWLRRNP